MFLFALYRIATARSPPIGSDVNREACFSPGDDVRALIQKRKREETSNVIFQIHLNFYRHFFDSESTVMEPSIALKISQFAPDNWGNISGSCYGNERLRCSFLWIQRRLPGGYIQGLLPACQILDRVTFEIQSDFPKPGQDIRNAELLIINSLVDISWVPGEESFMITNVPLQPLRNAGGCFVDIKIIFRPVGTCGSDK